MHWIAASLLSLAVAMASPNGHLKMNFIDTEGGQATLIVMPSGESLLVDAGWPGNIGRDAKRIAEAAHAYGLKKIDYVLVTHYHIDHVGGVPELAALMPIGTVIDHGPDAESDALAQKMDAGYAKVIASGVKRLTVKAGDVLPVRGARVEVVSANGEVIDHNVAGGGQRNPLCGSEPRRPADPTENARSVGFVLTFGKFRTVDLGDLTWNKELELACPNHAVGPVDLLVVAHHGSDLSNSKSLVYGLKPRVAVMGNGARKGGSPAAWRNVASSPGLEDLWQLHYSVEGGAKANVPAERIANVEEHCQGFGIEADITPNGAFRVQNLRTGFTREYPVR